MTEEDALQRPLLGISLRVGAMIMFTLMAVLIKSLTKSGLPEIQLIFFRSLFGLIPVLAWIAFYRRPDLIGTQRPVGHSVRAIIGLSSMFCMFMGLARLPLNDATAIGYATPIFATAMSVLVLGERIGIHRGIAILAGFGGVLFLTGAGSDQMLGIGALFMVISTLLGAAVSVTIRQISRTEHSVTIAFYFMMAGVLISGLAMPFVWVTPSPESWPLLIALGLCGGLLQLLLSGSLRYGPVSVVMPFDYTQIIFAALISWLVWAELPTSRTIVGGIIVIASGLYIFYRETMHRVGRKRAVSTVEEG